MLGIAPRKTPFDAAMAAVRFAILIGHHADQLLAAHFRAESAADPAIGAGCNDAAFGRSDLHDLFFHERGRRTCLHTGTAGNTFRTQKIIGCQPCGNLGIPPAAFHRQGEGALHLVTGANAARAGDAFAGVKIEIGVGMVLFLTQMRVLHVVTHFTQTDRTGLILQFAIAICRTGQTIERMVGNIELHDALAQLLQVRGLRMDDHSGLYGRCATGGCAATSVDFHKAQAARSEAFQIVGGAQLGDRCSLIGRRAHDARSGRNRYLPAINRAGYKVGRPARGCAKVLLWLIGHMITLHEKWTHIIHPPPDCRHIGPDQPGS